MAGPHMAQTCPYFIGSEPDDYCWCGCEYSNNKPFCDGSHQEFACNNE